MNERNREGQKMQANDASKIEEKEMTGEIDNKQKMQDGRGSMREDMRTRDARMRCKRENDTRDGKW